MACRRHAAHSLTFIFFPLLCCGAASHISASLGLVEDTLAASNEGRLKLPILHPYAHVRCFL
jgi:hypothetical protein